MADKPGHNERSAPGSAFVSASICRGEASRQRCSSQSPSAALRRVCQPSPVSRNAARRRRRDGSSSTLYGSLRGPPRRTGAASFAAHSGSRGRARRQGRPRRQPWSFCSHSCAFLKKSVGQISCGDNIGTPRVTGPVVRHRQRVAVLASSTASVDAVVEIQRSRLQAIKRPRPGPGRMRRRGRFRFAASRGQCRIGCQVLGQLAQEGVAGMPLRHDEMASESDFRRAHGPDVQIMQALDVRSAKKERAHLSGVDAGRRGRHGHANRVAQETPGRPDDDGVNCEATTDRSRAIR